MTRAVAVLGLGNPLMTDDGIGVKLVEALRRRGTLDAVDLLDAGTAGFGILHLIAGRRKVVFLDCARMGLEPGAWRCFRVEDVESRKRLPGHSLHEADLLRLLQMARQLGDYPEQVLVWAVEPERVAPGTDLSAALQERLDEYLQAIEQELECH